MTYSQINPTKVGGFSRRTPNLNLLENAIESSAHNEWKAVREERKLPAFTQDFPKAIRGVPLNENTPNETTLSTQSVMKQIQFTSGCPNNCSYCYEPMEMKYFNPEIPQDQDIQILDMNFLANPKAKDILRSLPKKRYEFVCGVDYRLMDQEIADLMKEKGFIKVRWAWDYQFGLQRQQKKVWMMFKKAGYRLDELSVFILANWRIPFEDCCRKLDLLKVWNVKVNDCCFDGGYPKTIAKYVANGNLSWKWEEMKRFRKMCRKHNQMVRFKIDPEWK